MQSRLKQSNWVRKRRFQLYIGSNELKTSFNKFKGSIFAIIFGIIVGSIVIGSAGKNVFQYFHYILWFAFTDFPTNNWDNTLVWWAVYITAGLALVLSFKTGLFNIGVAGQMMAAGTVIMVIGIRYNYSQPIEIMLALFLAVIVSMAVAAVIAFLKVMFNIHEVVTSILLNWIILYLIKWIFMTSNDLYDASSVATKPLNSNMSLAIGGYKFILPLILAFCLIITVWLLLKSTTLGFKLRTVGLNPFAAKYSGISRRQYSFTAFVISGAIVGFMAFIYYVGINPAMTFTNDILPAIGFDSISVALVGQINAWGVGAAAFLYAIIKSGGPIGSVGLQLPNAIGDIIFGVIIYSAACAALLARIQPLRLIISYYTVATRTDRRAGFKTRWNGIWTNLFAIHRSNHQWRKKIKTVKIKWKQAAANSDDKKTLQLQIIEMKKQQVEQANLYKTQTWQAQKALHIYVNKEYQAIWNRGMFGINNSVIKTKKALFADNLNLYINTKNEYDKTIHQMKENYKTELKQLKQRKSENYWVEKEKITQQFKTQFNQTTNKFNQQFLTILQSETNQLIKINQSKHQSKGAYLKDKEQSKLSINHLKKQNQEIIKQLKAQKQSISEINKTKEELQQKINEINIRLENKQYFKVIKGEQ